MILQHHEAGHHESDLHSKVANMLAQFFTSEVEQVAAMRVLVTESKIFSISTFDEMLAAGQYCEYARILAEMGINSECDRCSPEHSSYNFAWHYRDTMNFIVLYLQVRVALLKHQLVAVDCDQNEAETSHIGRVIRIFQAARSRSWEQVYLQAPSQEEISLDPAKYIPLDVACFFLWKSLVSEQTATSSTQGSASDTFHIAVN